MSLYDEYLKKFQEINDYTHNPLIGSINLHLIEAVEIKSSHDPFLKEITKKLYDFLSKLRIDGYREWIEVYTIYSEAELYLKLSGKIAIEHIKEEQGQKTPDFKVTIRKKEYGIELKSVSFADAFVNYREVLAEGLEKKIEIEDQIANGETLIVTEQSIAPYTRKQPGNSKSQIINSLINKIEQNLKQDQFKFIEPTILLINLSQLGTASSTDNSIKPFFLSTHIHNKKVIANGELWHTAFGTAGNTIWKEPMGYNDDIFDRKQEKDGILVSYPWIRGLIFYSQKHSSKQDNFLGLYRSDDLDVYPLLENICNYINDDKNSLV
ncbi:MAG: hypothetical protein A2Y41_04800 [Spirochaetes bacterium GWB1_36_13]|nr:MAG: hypothetical protein A2Y41_04800 [Spirochaetes bacterium GWB1_36_13]